MSKKQKILGLDLESIIAESLSALFEDVSAEESTESMKEKLRQQQAAQSASKRKKLAKKDPQKVADKGAEVQQGSKPVKIKHEKLPEVNLSTVVDKLNSIRAGKSLKDAATKKALKTYFRKLNGPERIALFAFLSGIEKILGDAQTNVKAPHADPYNIDMEKEKTDELKPKAKGTKAVSNPDSSDTPIIVGERADISRIKTMLWRK